MARTLGIRLTRLGGMILALLVLGVAPAQASSPPECWNTSIFARPGIERPYELPCFRMDAVELVAAPAHGALTDLRFDKPSGRVRWRYKPVAGAPDRDSLRLRLSGPNGSTEVDVTIVIVPLSRNTAPTCEPVDEALRTDGTAPATLELHVSCSDEEHDTFTINGAGPGVHLDAPKTVQGGHQGVEVPWWRYRTAAHDGEEMATIWATDDLGARGPEARMRVRVGPGIDQPATCIPNPYVGYAGQGYAIWSRPGLVRRFAVICTDPDGDPIHPAVGEPPARGTLTTFAPSAPRYGWWGSEVWIDGRYEPGDSSAEPDEFTVTTTGRPGTAPTTTLLSIAPTDRQLGGSCTYTGAGTTIGKQGALHVICSDDHGEPIELEVTRGPDHGTLGATSTTPVPYGNTDFAIPYTPAAGFEGVDSIAVRISDGRDFSTEFNVDLYVSKPPAPPSFPGRTRPRPVRPRPTLPPSSVGEPTVDSPLRPLELARRALRSRNVRLLRQLGPARLYAKPASTGVSVAVVCESACSLTTWGKSARQRVAARPGRPGVLKLKLTPAQRKAARRAGHVALRMRVQAAGVRSRQATVRVPFKR